MPGGMASTAGRKLRSNAFPVTVDGPFPATPGPGSTAFPLNGCAMQCSWLKTLSQREASPGSCSRPSKAGEAGAMVAPPPQYISRQMMEMLVGWSSPSGLLEEITADNAGGVKWAGRFFGGLTGFGAGEDLAAVMVIWNGFRVARSFSRFRRLANQVLTCKKKHGKI